MMNGATKRILGAFLIGGCVGVATQLIYLILGAILGADFPLLLPLTMLCLALVGAVTTALGWYAKFAAKGAEGGDLAFTGFVFGAIGLFQMGYEQGGFLAGAKASCKLLFYVLVFGSLISTLIGALTYISGLGV